MDNRELTVSTFGGMIEVITDSRLESMLDQLYEDISEGQYYDSAYHFIELTEDYFYEELEGGQQEYIETKQGEGFSEKRGRITAFEAIAAFLVAVGVAGGICSSIQSDHGMKRRPGKIPDSYMDYRRRSRFIYWQDDERLIHEFVTQKHLPKRTEPVRGPGTRLSGGRSVPRTRHSGGSTTHISSSGRRHGGGSRKF